MENGLSLGEAMALTNKEDGFGGWFMWIIALAIIFGNGGGFGFGGGNRGFVDGTATREAVATGFQYNQLDNGIRGIQQGICDGFYAINNSIKDCCCETGRAIDSVKYDMSKGFCDVITAGNLNTRDILENNNAGVQRILDYLCANEKQALRDRIQTLETSSIVQAQTRNLLEALRCGGFNGCGCNYGF